MSRDLRKLRVFTQADELVLQVYRLSEELPESECFGLQAQMRRASVAIPTNIAEGAGRHSRREYAHFLNIASGSLFEIRYLVTLGTRLGYFQSEQADALVTSYTRLAKELHCLAAAVRRG